MTKRCEWTGNFVVMVTPFNERGNVSDDELRRLVDMLIDEGADGLVVAGSTGEYFSLSREERLRVFEIVADQARKRVRLIAGTTDISTRHAAALTESAKRLGYDGALVLPPPYVIPSVTEVVGHFSAIDEVGLPLMLYNNPARTGVNLDAGYIEKLLPLKHFVALKDSAKDIGQISATLRRHRDAIAVFPGMEPYLLPSLQRGAAGIVSMAPNVLGAAAISLYRLASSADASAFARVQERVDRLYARMYAGDYNPYVVIKESMRLLGRPGGWTRDPLLPMAASDRAALRDLLREIGPELADAA